MADNPKQTSLMYQFMWDTAREEHGLPPEPLRWDGEITPMHIEFVLEWLLDQPPCPVSDLLRSILYDNPSYLSVSEVWLKDDTVNRQLSWLEELIHWLETKPTDLLPLLRQLQKQIKDEHTRG